VVHFALLFRNIKYISKGPSKRSCSSYRSSCHSNL